MTIKLRLVLLLVGRLDVYVRSLRKQPRHRGGLTNHPDVVIIRENAIDIATVL
jgi:hypothetical protein